MPVVNSARVAVLGSFAPTKSYWNDSGLSGVGEKMFKRTVVINGEDNKRMDELTQR